MKRAATARAARAVTILLLGAMLTGQARAETLADTLISAYKSSGLLEQNRALLRAADEDVAQVVSELRPIINWTTDISRTFGRTQTNNFPERSLTASDLAIGVSLDLLLYDFGRTNLRIQAAKETVLATREALRGIEQEVLLRAVSAYMSVRENRELVAVRKNNLNLLREELRTAQGRLEVGEVTRTDIALAEAQLASARSGLASAEGNLSQSIEEFERAVGRAPGQLRVPDRLPDLLNDIEAAKRIALRNHPNIREAQFNIAAADLTVTAATAAMRPTVNLSAGLSGGEELGGSDFDRQGSVGISVTGPIYQGGRLSSAVRQALAQRDARRGQLHATSREVARNVGNAYARLQAARGSRGAGREQVRAAQRAFEGVREEARLGGRTTLDVLDAEQDLLDAEASLIASDADFYIAAYEVLATMGQLTVEDLRLNVKNYDPAAYYNLVKDAPIPISPQGRKLDRVLRSLAKNP